MLLPRHPKNIFMSTLLQIYNPLKFKRTSETHNTICEFTHKRCTARQ